MKGHTAWLIASGRERTCMHGSSESHGGLSLGARRPVRGGKNSKIGPVGDMQVAWGLGLDIGPTLA